MATNDRRQAELNAGAAPVPGSFAQALARADIDAKAFEAIAHTQSVCPPLKAPPTEARRATVLEIHRRIYRDLAKLETQRRTRREREAILGDIEGDIDLLWLTGELRLERPNLTDEIG